MTACGKQVRLWLEGFCNRSVAHAKRYKYLCWLTCRPAFLLRAMLLLLHVAGVFPALSA